jgi:(E)-4-hydroxy-3-methylbut-2-enyl-diphosphate synthase
MKKAKQTPEVKIGNKFIGGNHPVLIQSMTNTSTADAEGTASQIMALADSGSEIVRITVNDEMAAKAVPKIKEILLKNNYTTPLVGCFHYNGHTLLKEYKELAIALDKYRINPGNVGFGLKKDSQFEEIIEQAILYNKPVRIGVNWGSLDKDMAAKLMDANSKLSNPKSAKEVLKDALVMSAISSAKHAENIGLDKNKIVVSCKVSNVTDLVDVYQMLSNSCNYALHLGLTEAGLGLKGTVATTAALSILLSQGIGDTIRASITPKIGESRTNEVELCKEILQSIGFKNYAPQITACPGCGRTTSDVFQGLAEEVQTYIKDMMPIWRVKHPQVVNMKVAVMGCIVNGPGESKHANIGISLPGTGEQPIMPVFIDGNKKYTLRGDNVFAEFKQIVQNYVEENY